MIDFGQLASKASKFAIDHSPSILTTLGVVGTISGAIMAGKAAWQAADLVRLKEATDEERGEAIEDPREILKDRIKLTLPLFLPPAAVICASVACIIGAQRVNSKRAAGLAAAYTLAEKTHTEYSEKVKEKLGERKEEAVRNEVAQQRMEEVYLDDVRLSGIADLELCYDVFGNQFFRGSVEGIRTVVNDFNHMLIHDGYGSLAEFYRMLEFNEVPTYAENVGWNSDRQLEVSFGTTMVQGIKPCITIDFKHEPLPDYGRFRGR